MTCRPLSHLPPGYTFVSITCCLTSSISNHPLPRTSTFSQSLDSDINRLNFHMVSRTWKSFPINRFEFSAHFTKWHKPHFICYRLKRQHTHLRSCDMSVFIVINVVFVFFFLNHASVQSAIWHFIRFLWGWWFFKSSESKIGLKCFSTKRTHKTEIKW